MAKIREYWKHRTHTHLTVTSHVVDKKNLFFAHVGNLAAKVRLSDDNTKGKRLFFLL